MAWRLLPYLITDKWNTTWNDRFCSLAKNTAYKAVRFFGKKEPEKSYHVWDEITWDTFDECEKHFRVKCSKCAKRICLMFLKYRELQPPRELRWKANPSRPLKCFDWICKVFSHIRFVFIILLHLLHSTIAVSPFPPSLLCARTSSKAPPLELHLFAPSLVSYCSAYVLR